MARVRKHRSKWQVLHSDPITGRERSAGVFIRKIDADRQQRKIEHELDEGSWFDPRLANVVTVKDFSVDWLAGRVDLKASTRAGYEQILSSRVLPRWADHALAAVTHAELQRWISEMVGDGLSPNRVRNVFRVMSGLLGGAVKVQVIRANPAVGIRLPRVRHVEQRFLTPDQLAELANEVPDLYRTLILTLGVTGLRIGEAAALRRRDVDVLGRRIHVRENLERVARPGRRVVWEFGPPKNHKPRYVVIPSHLAAALNDHLIEFPGKESDFVFPTSTGRHITPAYLGTHILKPALARTDLPSEFRTHDLRHTAAAAMIRTGANPELVKRQLGHGSIQVTYDRYGHLFPDESDGLADALDDVWIAAGADQIRTRSDLQVVELSRTGVVNPR